MIGLNKSQSRGAIFRINLGMLGVVFWSAVAWFIWPSSVKWWGLGFLSIVCGLTAFALTITTIKAIWQLYTRDKDFSSLREKGLEQKSSRMASHKDLKKAGLIK